jgi:hypothetical protein
MSVSDEVIIILFRGVCSQAKSIHKNRLAHSVTWLTLKLGFDLDEVHY